MTANQFDYECTSRCIDPDIAFENANVQQALGLHDDDYVIEVLETEF